MEWHNTQLERQTGHHKDQTEHQYLVLDLARGDNFEDLPHFERAGGAIHHGQAIQQETRSQSTQHKVLHRCFTRGSVVTAQRHQGVAGQGQQLQTHVNNQEVVA